MHKVCSSSSSWTSKSTKLRWQQQKQRQWWNQMQWQFGSYQGPAVTSSCNWEEETPSLRIIQITTPPLLPPPLPIHISPWLMSWVQSCQLLSWFVANNHHQHVAVFLHVHNPCKTSTMSTWSTHWLRKQLGTTLQPPPILISINMVLLPCFSLLQACPPSSASFSSSPSNIPSFNSTVFLVVHELGSNSSYTSQGISRVFMGFLISSTSYKTLLITTAQILLGIQMGVDPELPPLLLLPLLLLPFRLEHS